MVTVYALTDPESHDVRYIGVTRRPLEIRLKEHLRERDKRYVTNWIKSLQSRNLIPDILEIEQISDEQIDEAEQFWVACFRAWNAKLTNGTKGGNNSAVPTLAVRDKIRVARRLQKMQPRSIESRAKTSAANRRRKLSTITRQKISMSLLGKQASPETRAKLSFARRGKPLSASHRAKLSLGLRLRHRKIH